MIALVATMAGLVAWHGNWLPIALLAAAGSIGSACFAAAMTSILVRYPFQVVAAEFWAGPCNRPLPTHGRLLTRECTCL
jgi:hypothetical protein